MANSNILLFDQLMQNMLSDQEYNTSQQRQNGVQAGIASSKLHNKFSYQVSLISYAIAQLMLANGVNALDSDEVSTFVGNLSASILQKVIDKANISQAQAGTDDTKWMSALQVANAIASKAVKLAGSTMTGPLILNGDPTQNLQAATKQYADSVAGTKIIYGSYAGNSEASRTIDLGFQPSFVLLLDEGGSSNVSTSYYGGLATKDNPVKVNEESTGVVLEIVSSGFNVFNRKTTGNWYIRSNYTGKTYNYICG